MILDESSLSLSLSLPFRESIVSKFSKRNTRPPPSFENLISRNIGRGGLATSDDSREIPRVNCTLVAMQWRKQLQLILFKTKIANP